MFANVKKINFYSGPAILPDSVILQAAEAINDFAGTGLSILEISHRSNEFVNVMEEARALVRELLQLNADREVLFMQGGGASQFFIVPMNLLNENETAAYLDTGQWAHLAMEEAKNFGKVHIAASSREEKYRSIPKELSLPDKVKYLHLTTNNTIYGTQISDSQIKSLQALGIPLVADMSSDIFSRRLDFNRFDLIYAAAQKNAGAAGVTIVVVNKNILGSVKRKLPKMLDYRQHIERKSMYNTPPVFSVYVSWLTLKWIKEQGLENIEQQNIRKAKILYEAIDQSSFFQSMAEPDDRSLMNVCFTAKNPADEERFLQFAAARNIVGIKGYRTVGGFRASIYNAMSEEGVAQLAQTIRDFK